ncbi:chaoptin isoform X2 [Cimex lectularius]|nr:chaoptin isoform X2 [Cimex lectularius]XP_024081744.1 chaoptin isoform X2 [Cimex lectularius]
MHLALSIMMTSLVLMFWLTYASGYVCHFDPHCTCSMSSSVQHLGNVECKDGPSYLPSFNTSKLVTLSLVNNDMHNLPPNQLLRTGLYKLEISKNPIYYLHEESLTGLERSLWEIHITDCKLSNIPANALRHLNKLKILNLTGNDISTITSEQLKGVANSLNKLILADNHISVLPHGVFSSLNQLEVLDIHGNSIVSLEPGVFTPPPAKLKILDLSDNLIDSMSYKQLANIKMLHTLNLNSNKISTLYDASTNVKLVLDKLFLEYNDIEELISMSMTNFDVANITSFKGNPLVNIQPNAFQGCRITELNLSNCKLRQIDPESFNGLENTLQSLDLTGNNISTFSFPLLLKYENLRLLNLDYNNIKNLLWMNHPEEMEQEVQLTELSLTGKTNSPFVWSKLPKMVHLQSLAVSRIEQPHINPKDFQQFSVELETLKINDGNLKSLNRHMFQMVRGIKTLDLTDNTIEKIDAKSLIEISHSLEHLILTHSLDKKIRTFPKGFFKHLNTLQVLKINHNFLQKIPSDIQFLSNLEIFHAQDNNLDGIPKGSFKARNHKFLHEIDLSFNKITKISSKTFADLIELTEINLSDNRIVTIEHGSFVNLEKLTHLWLRGNKIQYLNSELFQNLPALSVLDLAYNSLVDFNFACLDQVGMLSSLNVNVSHNSMNALKGNSTDSSISIYIKIVDFSHNNISSVDKTYFMPVQHSLTKLFMSDNAMINATRDLFPEMLQLQLLDMSFNQMNEIEFDALRSLKQLQIIDLSHNNLTSIPIGLFQSLNSVRHIDLSSNHILQLFDSIISPASLISADLSDNSLLRVPLTAFSPSAAMNVLELSFRNNKITNLPSSESFSRFTKLRSLDVSSNRITDMGSAFNLLPSLTDLKIGNNFLHIGNRDFVGLENTLEHLDISNISISYVPPMPLPSLRTLKMDDNFITYIPMYLQSNLTSLKHLDVSYNALQSLPDVPQLNILNIAGNPISSINNTSFVDFPHLVELDIRGLPLHEFAIEGLVPLQDLETLHISNYKKLQNFNVPTYIKDMEALRTLHFEVTGASQIGTELNGLLSERINNLIITGHELKSLPDNLLHGVQSPVFKLTLRNTSVENIQAKVFSKNLRSLVLDVEENYLTALGNPSNVDGPNRPHSTYLTELYLSGNKWNCDCKLGWIETWQRKRRQYGSHDYTIDDVREAQCKNKQNKSMLFILKSELECGWSDGNTLESNFILITLLLCLKLTYTSAS